MKYFKDKRILITGASSGIGAEFARFFISCGAKVALLARRLDWLQEVSQSFPDKSFLLFSVDVTDEKAMFEVVQQVQQEWQNIDIVIANAGFGVGGFFDSLKVDDFRRQFDVNFFGVLNTIYPTLEALTKSKGQIVAISSIAGRIGVPALSAYNASKYAVCGLCDSIYYELKQRSIAITCVQPGIVDSNFSRVDNYNQYSPTQEDKRPHKIMMPTNKAVVKIAHAIRRRKRAVTITGHGKTLLFINRFCPLVLRFIMSKVTKKRQKDREDVQKS